MSKPSKQPAGIPTPTDGELAILQVLWARGPSTVRQVLGEMNADTKYTTVLKLMQIMAEKGLVRRDERERTHIYAAAVPAQTTQRQLLWNLVEKAFAGSAAQLVLQALSAKRATPEELKEIRKLLDEHEQGEKKNP